MMFGWLITVFIRCDLKFLNVHNGFKPKGIYNQKGKYNISFVFKWHLYLHGIWGVHSRFEFKVEYSSDFDNWSKMDHIFFPNWSIELIIKFLVHFLKIKHFQKKSDHSIFFLITRFNKIWISSTLLQITGRPQSDYS